MKDDQEHYGRDMLRDFVSYDEAADFIANPQREANRLFVAAGVLASVLALVVWASWPGVEVVAPTAAEVSAPGFDLEAKMAEIEP